MTLRWLALVSLTVGCEAGSAATDLGYTRLWVPHLQEGELRAWDAGRLGVDVDAPDVVITLPVGAQPNAVAFDAEGDLWVTDNGNNRLLEIAADDLRESGSPTPSVIIDSDGASLIAPIGLLWDTDGGLWVATMNGVEHYASSNLDDPGPTTPDCVLTSPGFDIPAGLIWDDRGDLWMTDAAFGLGDAVMVFTPDQLAAAGAQTPSLELQSASFALVEGLAFDDAGDLWVSSNDGLAVSRVSASDLALPAAPEVRQITPIASLESDGDDSASGRTVRKPGGLVFTPDGDLFVNSERANADDSAVLRFGADQVAQLASGVAVQAETLVARATSNPGFGGMALEP